jgi:hypothetical protein
MTNSRQFVEAFRAAYEDILDESPLAPDWERATGQVVSLQAKGSSPRIMHALAGTAAVVVFAVASLGAYVIFMPSADDSPAGVTTVTMEETSQTTLPSTTVPEDPSEVVPVPRPGAGALGNNGMNDGPWVFSETAGSLGAFVTWFEVGEPPVLHVDVVECVSDDCSSVVRSRLEGLTGVDPWPVSRPLVLSDGSWAWVSGPELVICDDSVCSKTSRTTFANNVWGGNAALTDDGRPVFVLALNDPPGSGAAVVVCADSRCETGSPVTAILDDVAVPLPFSALAIDRGRLAYAYRDPDSATLHLVTCGDLGCANPISIEVVPPIGDSEKGRLDVFSLAVGSDGLPVLVYGSVGEPRQLRVVHCENWACTELSDTAVSELHGFWQGPSLAIGSDGNPVMAFQSNDSITVLKCGDVTCTRTTISYPLGETPGDPSLVIGSDGNPIIAFFPPIPSEDEEAGTEPAAGTELIGDDPVLFRCLDLGCTGPSA